MDYLDLSGDFHVNKSLNSITYIISDVEEPISKKVLLQLKDLMGGDFTLHTNAGIQVHSSEMENNTWNGIKIFRN